MERDQPGRGHDGVLARRPELVHPRRSFLGLASPASPPFLGHGGAGRSTRHMVGPPTGRPPRRRTGSRLTSVSDGPRRAGGGGSAGRTGDPAGSAGTGSSLHDGWRRIDLRRLLGTTKVRASTRARSRPRWPASPRGPRRRRLIFAGSEHRQPARACTVPVDRTAQPITHVLISVPTICIFACLGTLGGWFRVHRASSIRALGRGLHRSTRLWRYERRSGSGALGLASVSTCARLSRRFIAGGRGTH